MRPPLRVGTVYDFRNTPDSGMDMPNLYAAIMDQVVMLDTLGLDLVWFTEHHFLDDGYLPSWVPMAGAIAARTKRVRLSSDVCLLPFNHPLRLAEDLAVLDNISNGRIEVGVGMGYAPHEFRGFGDAARRIQELYLAGHKDEAIATVPDEWVDLKSLVGPPARIRKRYRAWQDSGAHSLSVRSRQSEAIEVMAEAARLN